MELEQAKEDYYERQYKKYLRFRRCYNCKFKEWGAYHDICLVKDNIIDFNFKALFCKYYRKGGINNGN